MFETHMDTNPYHPPQTAGFVRPTPRVPYAKIFFGTALVVLLVNALFYALMFLTLPPSGSPGTYYGMFLFLAFELFNLPGIPPFLVLHFSDLLPDEDDWVRGIVFIACSAITWSLLATCVSPLIRGMRRSKQTPFTGETSTGSRTTKSN
jgi:hypothetical protein